MISFEKVPKTKTMKPLQILLICSIFIVSCSQKRKDNEANNFPIEEGHDCHCNESFKRSFLSKWNEGIIDLNSDIESIRIINRGLRFSEFLIIQIDEDTSFYIKSLKADKDSVEKIDILKKEVTNSYFEKADFIQAVKALNRNDCFDKRKKRREYLDGENYCIELFTPGKHETFYISGLPGDNTGFVKKYHKLRTAPSKPFKE